MSKSNLLSYCARAAIALGILATTSFNASAATVIWSGASGTDTNWSNGANWAGGTAPGSNDDVRFTDDGTNGAPGTANMLVDGAFSGYIGSLRFAQSNGWHTIQITDGNTLYITNANGLYVGTITNVGAARALTNSIKGALGATLNVTNPAASIVLNQGETNALNGARAILNLSGLDNFNATVYAIGIGSLHFPAVQGAAGQRNSGTLFLARTNVIKLGLTDTLANYSTLGNRTNALEMVYTGSGNNAGTISFLSLGQTNAFYVDSFGFARSKASASSAASVFFNPAFANSTAFFRGTGGNASRVTWWSIGDMADFASSAQVSVGTNDFSLGTVDALVDTMSLGRDSSSQHTTASYNIGVLTFAAGTIDVNTLIVGNQILGPNNTSAGNLGIVNVNAAAKLVVNSSLDLGRTTLPFNPGVSGTNAWKTLGTLNIRNGGLVLANRITVGAASSNCVVTISNATLLVSNNIATAVKGLTTFAATNATLRLFVTGITNLFCTNFVSAGTSNLISPDSVSVFSSYPKQVVLIKYATAFNQGVTNWGLTNLPASAPGAYLSNNVANSSLDLVLPTDPRPIIVTNPASYSGNPGDNVTFSVTVSSNSVLPLAYQWYLGATPLANGATGNGSTLSGATTASLTITSAQAADNGNYTVVVTNAYGSATSATAVLTISAGCVAPGLTGPNNTTVIQSNNATLSATAAGNPVPDLQWRRNGVDIAGQTGSSYTITNAIYPTDDGAVFSLVASNACGMVTNSATLTVIVPPVISVQPVSLVVTSTQPASFSVMASGVPAPTYQWQFNTVPISGETNSTLNIASAASANIGTYRVVVNNAAGSVTSSNATLIVNSVMATTALSPANGALGICYDTPLAITFNATPSLGTAGTIKIYNTSNSATPVDTINVALGANQQRSFPGDGQSFTYQTIQISGNTAKIYPHFSVMSSNATYYVTIDNSAFTDASGAYFSGITATNVWQFATKVGGPVDSTNPVVNADGSGDFLTVQGAVNSLATGTNATQRVVSIRNGLYNEIVDITSRNNVTLRGQSRAGAVLYFPNNATFQTVNSGTTHARMSFKVNANDVVLDTLTISNSTPQGGSQAEALMIESNAKRCIVYNSEIDSRQDTILGNQNSSQTYFYKSIIKGNFDYIWGGGNFYFDQCTIQTIAGTGSGQLTAARTDTSATTSTNFPWANPGGTFTANGMSFVNCTFTSDPGLSNITLAGSNGTAANNVSWYGCDFATNYVAPSASLFSGNFVFWQSANTMTNSPVTFPVLTTISGNDARLLAATNIPTWFYGWSPSIPPTIVTNPVSQTVTAGQSASFGVLAAGIPNPTYQWQHAGTNLPGATSSTLNIASAKMDNAGSYAVVVSTPAGSVASGTATLTVNALNITVTPNGQTKVYGTMDPALTYTYNPALLMGDSFSGALSRAMGENVGSYAITQSTLSLNANYSITFITTSNLVITPAALSITAANTNKVIGQTITFAGTEFTTSALVMGDSVTSVTLTSAGAASGAAAGMYPIVPSAAVGSGLGNYNITYNNGTLTVTGSPNSNVDSIVANPDGSVTVTISGSNGLTYRIQAATDLTNPAWTDVSTNTISGGTSSFTDTNTTGVTKFYRAVYP